MPIIQKLYYNYKFVLDKYISLQNQTFWGCVEPDPFRPTWLECGIKPKMREVKTN